MRFEVVLPGRPAGSVEAFARAMAGAFGIPEAKAAVLLQRTPGALTKAIDEREAVRVAYKLRRIGLAVDVRPVDVPSSGASDRVPHGEPAAATPRASRPRASSGASPSASDPAPHGHARSPFLSQVDETAPAPPRIGGVPSRASVVRASGAQDVVERAAADRPGAPDAPSDAASVPRSTGAGTGAVPDPEAHAAPRSPYFVPYRAVDAGAAAASRSRARRTERRTGRRSDHGRGIALAAVAPGAVALLAAWAAPALVPDGPSAAASRAVASAAAGLAALALSATAVWLAGRRVAREHARVMEDVVRISRGDLGRPVEPSDRYPEAAQSLERIRVSLQEGLERLRRRRR